MTLSNEQQTVLDLVRRGENVFFTGCAGTGKSFLLQEIIKDLKERCKQEEIGITASTGIAAVNIGGCTVHSLIGINEKGSWAHAWNRKKELRELKILIIDEISMLSAWMFQKVNCCLTIIREQNMRGFEQKYPGLKGFTTVDDDDYQAYFDAEIAPSAKPFGGVQLVLCGDFLQLPPVFNKLKDPASAGQYCFEASSWGVAIPNVVVTKTVFRQTDKSFSSMLNDIRIGNITNEHLRTLSSLQRNKLVSKNGVIPTQLFTTNKKVDELNTTQLNLLTTPSQKFETLDLITSFATPDNYTKSKLEKDMNARIPSSLDLKVGAQVILLRNMDKDLVNGSRGVVVEFKKIDIDTKNTNKGREVKRFGPSFYSKVLVPLVKFENGMTREVSHCVFNVESLGGVVCSRIAVPLKLSWAITVHKCQGMTLDQAVVDLGYIFADGLGYVSLSRVRSIQGLQITTFDKQKIGQVSAVALRFYNGTYARPPPPRYVPKVPVKSASDKSTNVLQNFLKSQSSSSSVTPSHSASDNSMNILQNFLMKSQNISSVTPSPYQLKPLIPAVGKRERDFNDFIPSTKRRKGKYYAVKAGRRPGIYYSWEECQAQVSGFPNAIFKSFETEAEASEFCINGSYGNRR
ncbi:ATP-dependent DNA helicase PIF1 [Acrasis kona]|uniref:ATP-dependent DNA helicase n=1 Tax=Acrasis kona TaxID=1008807 RepID=A0AAW2Z324_9EUKA